MDHVPSGHFFANSAWLCCAVLAHDLVRWCAFLGGIVDKDELTVTAHFAPLLLGACPLVNRSGIPRLVVRTNGPGPAPSSKRWESFAPRSRSWLSGPRGSAQPQTFTMR